MLSNKELQSNGELVPATAIPFNIFHNVKSQKPLRNTHGTVRQIAGIMSSRPMHLDKKEQARLTTLAAAQHHHRPMNI